MSFSQRACADTERARCRMIRPVVFVAVSSLGFLWWLTRPMRPSGHCQSCGHPDTEHYEGGLQCHASTSPTFGGPFEPCPCVGYWPPDDSLPGSKAVWPQPARTDEGAEWQDDPLAPVKAAPQGSCSWGLRQHVSQAPRGSPLRSPPASGFSVLASSFERASVFGD